MPAEAPTLLVDDHRTLVYATARGEHQGGHAEPLDAVDSALRGSNNTTIIIVVGSGGSRTARLCALACQGGDGAEGKCRSAGGERDGDALWRRRGRRRR